MDFVTPVSVEEHLRMVETVKARAEAIASDDIREPDLPVAIFIKEAGIAASGAREHFEAMAKVGFSGEMITALETDIRALDSAQQLWNRERRGGRSSCYGNGYSIDFLLFGPDRESTFFEGQMLLSINKEQNFDGIGTRIRRSAVTIISRLSKKRIA